MCSRLAAGRGYPSLTGIRGTTSPVRASDPAARPATLSHGATDSELGRDGCAAPQAGPREVPPPPHVVPREATQLDRGIREVNQILSPFSSIRGDFATRAEAMATFTEVQRMLPNFFMFELFC